MRLAERHPVRAASAAAVRSRIANLILGKSGEASALGAITLHPHQRSAVDRLLTAIDRFNGALLCDEVGMGKTYVALTIARSFGRCLIVAPAALVPMWRVALSRTDTTAEIMTFEALSRADASERSNGKAEIPLTAFDFVIVDEAHHVRNARTNRFFALESLVRGAKVLMLTATPIHNKRTDLVALFSLFLGSRARALTSAELALCVVRRERKQIEQSLQVPTVLPTLYHELPDDPTLVEQLMDLPPPVPFRDGGIARALVGRGLVHLWASSEAALYEALKRRIARASALCASLEAGTYPTARELETWVYGEGSLQLAFAELLSAPTGGHRDLLDAVRAHLIALQEISGRVSANCRIDQSRIGILADIASSDNPRRIVAFSQYAETVSMLFRGLVREGRVAMLTSHGARVAGGALTRAEAISRFAPIATGSPPPASAEIIEQLLTTDLLSEGVNLQDADTVIHLDLPWTTARLEQRVGRVARLDSPHSRVAVHLLRPPRSAEKLLGGESIVRHKWRLAKSAVGTSSPNPAFDSTPPPREDDQATAAPVPERVEQLRAILEHWQDAGHRGEPAPTGDDTDVTIVATVDAPLSGFIAAVTVADSPRLLVGVEDKISVEVLTQIDLCAHAGSRETETDLNAAARAVELVLDWARSEKASAAAGLTSSNALRRRDITRRIDASIESAPPHLRALRLIAAERARAIATSPQCAGVERELNALLESELSDDEWLHAVAALETTAGRLNETSTDPLRIHAILILENRAIARRSPSPPAAESP